MRRTRRARVGVVVPARDERERLPACLDALAVAAAGVRHRADVRVVVVLDSCRDGTGDVVGPPVERLRVEAGNVGVARGAGCGLLLAGPRPVDWLASTDADTVVGPDWLAAHVDALDDGRDALLGTVVVGDWEDHPPATRTWFAARHAGARDVHPHVHGANLGVAAAAYRRVGGFPPSACHEDVGLVERLERDGARVRRSRAVTVVTSARRGARVTGGFADRLVDAGG